MYLGQGDSSIIGPAARLGYTQTGWGTREVGAHQCYGRCSRGVLSPLAQRVAPRDRSLQLFVQHADTF